MAGATYRSSATVSNTVTTTSVTVSMPAGTTDGDLLVAVVNALGTPTITAPAGWTLVETVDAGSTMRSAVYHKTASSEPASWTWTLSPAARRWGYVAAYTSWDTGAASPVLAEGTAYTSSGTGWAAYAGGVRLDEARYVVAVAASNTCTGSATTWTSSASTERADVGTNAGLGNGADISGAVYEATTLPTPPPAELDALATLTASQTTTAAVVWTIAIASAFALPSFPLDVVVEAAWGADPDADPATWGWTDISTYVMDPGVTLTKARRNEQPSLEPCSLSFRLLNPDGRFTPRNPSGAYWPDVVRGVPIRVSLDGIGVQPPYERITAFVGSWTPRWDTSLNLATVEVQASGRLRRINRRTVPIRSTLYRLITADGPVAYWPLEDDSGANQAYVAVGDTPLTWSGGTPTLGSGGPDGSAGAITLASTTELTAPVVGTSSTAWSVECAVRIPSAPGSNTRILQWLTGSGTYPMWAITIVPGTPDVLRIEWFSSATSGVVASSSTNFTIDGTEPYATDLMVVCSARQNGGNVEWEVACNSADGGTSFGGSFAGTLGTLGSLTVSGAFDHSSWQYSHISAWDKVLDDPWASYAFSHWTGLDGWSAERSVARFTRVCGEAGIESTVVDPVGDIIGEQMGPQPADSLADVLREIEALDAGGTIHDGGESGALVYVPRSARYNRPVDMALDMDAGEVAPPLAPTYDDQGLRTEVTVSRDGGSSHRAAVDSPDGVYEHRASVNASSDTQLADLAGWLLHTGSVTELRYPSLSLDLRRNPGLAQQWAYAQPGLTRITVTNLPSQHPPGDVDVYLEGYTETISAYGWRVQANCSPASPYAVFEIEDETYGRIDTGASELSSVITSSATSVDVTTTDGPTWTTAAADLPLEIEVDGEVMTVTAIGAPGAGTQTFTVTRSSNGVAKSHLAGTPVRLYRAPVIAL